MSIANATTLQLRSVKALMLKRFRNRYAGSRAGYAWAIVEPMAWVFVLKFGFAHHTSLPPVGDSFEVFFTTGVVLARTWRSAANTITGSLLRTSKMTFPVINRMDETYAIWVMEMVTGGFVMITILCILGLFGFSAAPDDLLTCLIVYGAMSIFTLAFGLAFALVVTLLPFMNHFKNIVLMIMFFTSGFASVLDRMPPSWREVVSWNPMVHFVEWFREGFYPGYECANLDLEYVFTVTVVFMLIGLMGERALRRRTLAPKI